MHTKVLYVYFKISIKIIHIISAAPISIVTLHRPSPPTLVLGADWKVQHLMQRIQEYYSVSMQEWKIAHMQYCKNGKNCKQYNNFENCKNYRNFKTYNINHEYIFVNIFGGFHIQDLESPPIFLVLLCCKYFKGLRLK